VTADFGAEMRLFERFVTKITKTGCGIRVELLQRDKATGKFVKYLQKNAPRLGRVTFWGFSRD
jgi:hypothetical protein